MYKYLIDTKSAKLAKTVYMFKLKYRNDVFELHTCTEYSYIHFVLVQNTKMV